MKGNCELCGGKDKPVKKQKITGVWRCQGCINPTAIFSRCGRKQEVYERDEQERPVCARCAREDIPKELCPGCQTEQVLVKRRSDGVRQCDNCHRDDEREVCSICEDPKPKRVMARTKAGGAICPGCWRRMTKMGICAQCNEEKILDRRNSFRRRICQACANNPLRRATLNTSPSLIGVSELAPRALPGK